MTHPDILTMEKFGELEPMRDGRQIGECRCCGAPLYRRYNPNIVFEDNNVFCNAQCRRAYMRSDGFAVLSERPMERRTAFYIRKDE